MIPVFIFNLIHSRRSCQLERRSHRCVSSVLAQAQLPLLEMYRQIEVRNLITIILCTSGQRILTVQNLKTDSKVSHVQVLGAVNLLAYLTEPDGVLQIRWESGHESCYSKEFLDAHQPKSPREAAIKSQQLRPVSQTVSSIPHHPLHRILNLH